MIRFGDLAGRLQTARAGLAVDAARNRASKPEAMQAVEKLEQELRSELCAAGEAMVIHIGAEPIGSIAKTLDADRSLATPGT